MSKPSINDLLCFFIIKLINISATLQFFDFRGFRLIAGTPPRMANLTEIGIGSIEGFIVSGPIILVGFIL